MSDQTKIQTLGPADPNAPIAAKAYTVTTGVLGLVGIAATFGLITGDQAASLGAVGTATTTLIGAVVAAVARFRVGKQINNGTFDEAPAPASNPIVDAFQAVDALETRVAEAVARTKAQAADGAAAIQGAVASIPGAAAVSTAVMSGNVGDLIQALTDRDAS